uniref:Uncharacterized protein n=1 Tax=Chromera velia CCMP2878 TaxID=1169474 RepID=A0A0G4GWL0_9ALVE|eukprot:Cvel_23695.t1-p1 / transcript=Cvel_23695.t1 / gene=Cvel_23695 / organism=Chromera_velia_CCMP2878 / gene_product=hypothetical protein / transcript_product=hypothetical protein / location=Cvel_scaffold2472:16038-17678(-) / protein_length=547 / sequence_SO=supercontig / SO=protein_coding / is_pseudo=false
MLVSPIEMFEGAVRLRSLWAAAVSAASDPAGAVGLSAEDRTDCNKSRKVERAITNLMDILVSQECVAPAVDVSAAVASDTLSIDVRFLFGAKTVDAEGMRDALKRTAPPIERELAAALVSALPSALKSSTWRHSLLLPEGSQGALSRKETEMAREGSAKMSEGEEQCIAMGGWARDKERLSKLLTALRLTFPSVSSSSESASSSSHLNSHCQPFSAAVVERVAAMAEAMRDDRDKEAPPMTDADFRSPAKPRPYRGVPNSASLADLSLSAPDALASLSVSVALAQENGEESESSSSSSSSSESQTQSSGPSPEAGPPPIHVALFGPASGPIAPPPQTQAQGSPVCTGLLFCTCPQCEEARLLDAPLPAAAAPGAFSAEGMLSQHDGQVTPPEMGVAAPWQMSSAGLGSNFGMGVGVEGGNGNGMLLHDPLGPLGWSGVTEESGRAWMGVGQAGGMGVMMGWDDGDAVGDSRVGWDGGRSFQIDGAATRANGDASFPPSGGGGPFDHHAEKGIMSGEGFFDPSGTWSKGGGTTDLPTMEGNGGASGGA